MQNTGQKQPSSIVGAAQATGHLFWLLQHSAYHSALSVENIQRLLFPAIERRQVKIYYDVEGRPKAFVTWAFLSPAVEQKILSGTGNLQPGDWTSGDRLWFVDIVAHDTDLRAIVADLRENVFPTVKEARSIRRRADGGIRKVNLWRRQGDPSNRGAGRPLSVRDVFHTVWGDDLHAGHFVSGDETLIEAGRKTNTAMIAELAPEPGDRILEIGCGFGNVVMELATRYGCEAVGIDLETWRIDRAADNAKDVEGVSFRQAAAEDLPFPDDHFDGVIAIEALSYVAGRQTAIAEMLRVLKPGGRLVLGEFYANEGRDLSSIVDRLSVPDFWPMSRWLACLDDAGARIETSRDWSAHARTTYERLATAFSTSYPGEPAGRVAIENMSERIRAIDDDVLGRFVLSGVKAGAPKTKAMPRRSPWTTLVMVSGGLDSVYTLWRLLSETDDEIVAHHINLVNVEGRDEIERERSARIAAYLKTNLRPFSYSETAIDHSGLAWFGYDIMAVGFEAGLIAHSFRLRQNRPIHRWTIGTCAEEGHWQQRFEHVQACCAANAFPHDPPDFFLLPPIEKHDQAMRLPSELLELTWGCRRPRYTAEGVKPCGVCKTCHALEEVRRRMNRAA